MKSYLPVLLLFLLSACQTATNSEERTADGPAKAASSLWALSDKLPDLDLPIAIDKRLLAEHSGKIINTEVAPVLSNPMELKAVRGIAQIKGFEQKMVLLYYAYPTDSEVDDYDQMALVAFDDLGNISAILPLDIGGTGFASTQNWIKRDGEILTAVIAEMEEVELEVKTYRFKDGRFTEARQFSKRFQDGSYQVFLDEL